MSPKGNPIWPKGMPKDKDGNPIWIKGLKFGPDGKPIWPKGIPIGKDGKPLWPPGVTFSPEGIPNWPKGTVIGPDGNPVWPKQLVAPKEKPSPLEREFLNKLKDKFCSKLGIKAKLNMKMVMKQNPSLFKNFIRKGSDLPNNICDLFKYGNPTEALKKLKKFSKNNKLQIKKLINIPPNCPHKTLLCKKTVNKKKPFTKKRKMKVVKDDINSNYEVDDDFNKIKKNVILMKEWIQTYAILLLMTRKVRKN